MEIPRSITVNTGEDAEVRETIERFFLEIRSEIEKKIKIREGPSKFRIDVKGLCKLIAGNPLESNEFAHALFYEERVVAVVIETRTDLNYIHFDYFSNLSNLNTKPL